MSNLNLEVRNITKSFPGVLALDNVSLGLKKGEVHGLCGMNGCGKSTLLKIITGNYTCDSGQIFVDGQEVKFHTVNDSKKAGIAMVYQELSLVPMLSVAENIYLGKMPVKNGLISYKTARKNAKELLDSLNLDIDPAQPVEELSVAEKQMVEIAKALSNNTKILLLDEPSAVLTSMELEGLFKIIRHIKSQGVTVVYISHRLEEVFDIADRVTVLRDGKFVGDRVVADLDASELIQMMVGRKMDDLFPELQPSESENIVMEVKNLRNPKLDNISFKLKEKEIIGIYGTVGSGQKELAEALFGVDTKELQVDEYTINGEDANIKNPVAAIKKGLAYIPEERKQDGLALRLSIRNNIVAPYISDICNKISIINKKKEDEIVDDLMGKLSVKAPNAEVLVNNLSGGNQQKIVIAKWLGKGSKVFICFEPTRGIDVDAKLQVYDALEKMRREGASVIIISSELSEVVGMCERMYIMRKGTFIGEIGKSEFDENKIIATASGLEV